MLVLNRRTALVIGLAILVIIVSAGGYNFLTSGTAPEQGTVIGAVDDFPPNTVTYIPAGHFFLVNWGRGLRAIVEYPPGLASNCGVRYRQPDDRVSNSPQSPAGGYFRSDCSPVRFNWWRGENLHTACQCGLDHFSVRGVAGQVVVDTTRRHAFTWNY